MLITVSAALVSQLILGGIFLRAGWSKLFSPSATADSLQAYQLLSNTQARLVAFLLPPLEVLIGVSYLAGFMLATSSILATFLLCIFSLAILINLVRGRSFPCYCFGNAQTPIGVPVLLRNLLLAMLSMFLLQQSFSNQQLIQFVSSWQTEFALLTHMDTLIFVVAGVATISGIVVLLDGVSSLLYTR